MFVFLLCALIIQQVICGLPQTRIVNGADAEYGKHGWQVSLQWNNGNRFSHICGGVLLKEDWVVTAAHCVEHDTNLNNFQMVVGKHTMSTDVETNMQKIRPAKITMHGSYNSNNIANDIALVKLSTPAKVGEKHVDFVHLPPYSDKITEYEGQQVYCYKTGWGRVEGGGDLPETLQEAETTVISNANCRGMLGLTGWLYLENFNVCIFNGISGSCNGDSGGPLVCHVPGSGYNDQSHAAHDWQLVGVTSWGLQGCPIDSPSVYTRISYYLDWIDANMV